MDYGDSAAIRSVVICTPKPGFVSLALEDMAHAFRMEFRHNGEQITQIEAEWIRHPITTCTGANLQLQNMIGRPLCDNLTATNSFASKNTHCTHMYDALSLGIVHATLQRDDCRYDVVIPDSSDGVVTARLKRNGETLMSLQLENYSMILSPASWANRSVFKGFLQWAEKNLSKVEYEYAFLLQKALFVARSQKYDQTTITGKKASDIGMHSGICFGSQPERYEQARMTGTHRLFSTKPENEVLKFFDLPQLKS